MVGALLWIRRDMRHDIAELRRDLSAQMAAVNTRIDNILLAERLMSGVRLAVAVVVRPSVRAQTNSFVTASIRALAFPLTRGNARIFPRVSCSTREESRPDRGR